MKRPLIGNFCEFYITNEREKKIYSSFGDYFSTFDKTGRKKLFGRADIVLEYTVPS